MGRWEDAARVAVFLALIGALIAGAAALIASGAPPTASEKPPMQIGAMTDTPPEPLGIELVLAVGGGIVPLDGWPKACDLLTDDELRSMLPQTERVRREPEDQEFEMNEFGLPGIGPVDTARDANCRYQLDMPGAGLPFDEVGGPYVGPYVELRVYAVGSPEIVELNFDRRGEPFELAGGTCSTDTVYGLSCHSESVAFTLDFSPVHDSVDAAERDTVESALAERVLAKLPAATLGP